MASFIPTLSLFILVLFNSYFTLPIVDEQLSSSTFPLLNDDLTTEHKVNVRVNFCLFLIFDLINFHSILVST